MSLETHGIASAIPMLIQMSDAEGYLIAESKFTDNFSSTITAKFKELAACIQLMRRDVKDART